MSPKLTSYQFDRIKTLLEKKIGFKFNAQNKFLLEKRLSRLVVHHKMGMDNYVNRLTSGRERLRPLIEAIITNETYFFREFSDLNVALKLGKEMLKLETEKLNILCAGCSTGEEGYSLLITMLEGGIPLDNINLDCFDISKIAIKIAQRGVYKGRSIKNIEEQICNKYFLKDGDNLVVQTKLRDKINFFSFNLLEIDLLRRKYDIIFCRNVLIYFSKHRKEYVLQLISEHLSDNGVFLMSKTESINRHQSNFQCIRLEQGKYYKKVGN